MICIHTDRQASKSRIRNQTRIFLLMNSNGCFNCLSHSFSFSVCLSIFRQFFFLQIAVAAASDCVCLCVYFYYEKVVNCGFQSKIVAPQYNSIVHMYNMYPINYATFIQIFFCVCVCEKINERKSRSYTTKQRLHTLTLAQNQHQFTHRITHHHPKAKTLSTVAAFGVEQTDTNKNEVRERNF